MTRTLRGSGIAGAVLVAASVSASLAVSGLQQTPEAAGVECTRMLEQAAAELQAGRPMEARQLLITAAERFDSVRALLQLARLQSGEGDAPGALATLARARELAPNAEEVLSATAQVSLAARAPVPAILALDGLTRVFPRVAQHHYLLGVALMQAGDMLAALDALREAERLEPSRHLTLVALGIALNNRKMFDEAKPILLRALQLAPDDVETLAALAEAEEGLDDLESAESHARRALASAPAHPTANLVAGMVMMKREQFAEARVALERAVAADPESPKAYYQLGLAWARLGDGAASGRNFAVYREKLRAMEARVEEIRKASGTSRGGMDR